MREQWCNVGWAWCCSQLVPNLQHEAAYCESVPNLHTMEQFFCDVMEYASISAGWDKPLGEINPFPCDVHQTPRTPDSRFSLLLLLASSAVSHWEEPHQVEELLDVWTEHGWQDLPPREQPTQRHDRRCAQFPSEPEERSGSTQEQDKNSPETTRLRLKHSKSSKLVAQLKKRTLQTG